MLKPIEILLYVESSEDRPRVEDELTDCAPFQFIMKSTCDFDDALRHLHKYEYDLILMDINTINKGGFDKFLSVRSVVLDVPIVILTGHEDEELAMRAVKEGAQDYIIKGQVNNRHLATSLQFAVTRQDLLRKLVNDSYIDELTGLYNRRGFLSMFQQNMRMLERTNRELLLFFIDLDEMKLINDNYGHKAGDLALIDIANIFRQSFRKSDIIGRIGGDEFAVLAMETTQKNRNVVKIRLIEKIDEHNQQAGRPYTLSVSVGIANYNPEEPQSISQLLETADSRMYSEKRSKKAHDPSS